MRTYAREPGRLHAFQRTLARLEEARKRGHALPEDLLEIWRPVEALSGRSRSGATPCERRCEVLPALKPFQRRTVEHAFNRLYHAPDSTGRFLVADEVGLGKTMVARGVVAKAIDRLRDEGVKRIDVIYVCSNQVIARQNISKLDGRRRKHEPVLDRVTMLPRT